MSENKFNPENVKKNLPKPVVKLVMATFLLLEEMKEEAYPDDWIGFEDVEDALKQLYPDYELYNDRGHYNECHECGKPFDEPRESAYCSSSCADASML